ncbi:heparinase II/III family protein [Streptomyces sp. RFCAC02]|uniref:heparinase II/III domain-containing protein n=1 Tax=Streptomyces sp. RFCAC02 TaxID=2499143 RepID=UPI001F105F87|nr:heparinase II/III family protein [Streptomyces sp. RFCAC02]
MAGNTLSARLALTEPPADGHDPLADALRDAPERLPVPPVTDRATWDAVAPATREGLLALAASALRRPPPVLRASDWSRALRDGVRTAHEDPARELRTRTALFVLAAVLTGEQADATAPPGATPHLDAAADGIVALCETTTWCWAPHDTRTAARGEVLADPDDPFLDLGAAEVTALLAWADHVLGPHLDRRVPGLRRRIRREVAARAVEPFVRVRDWHWIGIGKPADNWNPWIHSAVLAAALLLTDDPADRARVVRLALAGLDRFIAALPDDGGVDEGVAYWWHGACRLLESLDLVAAAGGPRLDARDLPVLRQLARFPHRMHLGGPWYVNPGDARARLAGPQPWHVLHRWGAAIGDPAVRAHALARAAADPLAARPEAGLGSALAALADPLWNAAHTAARADRAEAGDSPWLAPAQWLPRVQVLVARERPRSARGLTVAAKAGHNGERHNHLDVGSYWVAVDGRPLIVDIGQPTYTADSFGPGRYTAWPLRSAWHNVPEPGAEQAPGADRAARGAEARLTDGAAELAADLTAAYPPGTLDGWHRTVRLVRPARTAHGTAPAQVVVGDRWTGAGRTVRLRHILAGEVGLAAAHATVRPPDGRALRITWDPAAATAALDHRELDDPLLRASWGERLTRLTLTARPAVTALDVRMEVLP